MYFTTQCPNPTCRKMLRIPDERRGTPVACPSCRTRVDSTLRDDVTRPDVDLPPRGSDASLQPVVIDRYQIQAVLGSGGFGTVYRALDPRLEREVAIKVLRPEALSTAMAVERFQREAKAVARLNHPNIVPVYDAGQVGDRPYIVYALVRGKPMSDSIGHGGIDPLRAARLVARLAEALACAHEQGVLHRDVKPANVMLDPDDQPILLDFGLARQSGPGNATLTRTGTVLGTPAYMAPEQLGDGAHQLGPACDQYGLGVTLFQLLTGELPFSGPVHAVIAQVLFARPPALSKLRPGLDAGLEAICAQAMAKKPEERYPSVRAMARVLHLWQEAQTTRVVPPPLPTPALPSRRRAVLALACLSALTTTAAGWFGWKWYTAGPQTAKKDGDRSELLRLPKTLPPIFDVLSLERDRSLTIQYLRSVTVQFKFAVEDGGKLQEQIGTRIEWVLEPRKVPVADIVLSDTEGRKIDADRVESELEHATVVVLSADGHDVDPFYLLPVRRGTLIVKLAGDGLRPHSAGWPQQVVHPIQGLGRITETGELEIRVPVFHLIRDRKDVEPPAGLPAPPVPEPGKESECADEPKGKEPAPKARPEEPLPPVIDKGPDKTAPRFTQASEVLLWRVETVAAFETNGNRVDPERVIRRLETPRPVILSADDRPVHPFFLKCIKDDTLVFIPPKGQLPNPETFAPVAVLPPLVDEPKKAPEEAP